MKKLILAAALLLAPATITASPQPVEAQYSAQCAVQTYCGVNIYGYYACWQRTQCCESVYNPWTGAYAWQCVWR